MQTSDVEGGGDYVMRREMGLADLDAGIRGEKAEAWG
eukprot:ctg_6413.g616